MDQSCCSLSLTIQIADIKFFVQPKSSPARPGCAAFRARSPSSCRLAFLPPSYCVVMRVEPAQNANRRAYKLTLLRHTNRSLPYCWSVWWPLSPRPGRIEPRPRDSAPTPELRTARSWPVSYLRSFPPRYWPSHATRISPVCEP